MDTLQHIFLTVIAAFAFIVLISKIASAVVTNGAADADADADHPLNVQLNSNKRKSTKKVRFAVDHEEFVVNKSKSIVFEKNSIEIEENCGNESTDVDDNIRKGEYVSSCVDYDELKEGEIGLVGENVGNCEDGNDEADKEKEGLISEEDDDSDDDDWEGVERSDLEKVFAMAADYAKLDNNNNNLNNIESDVQMQLYALHKVATEGPCHEAQPMALKVSARAKWNAWQKLGNMNPDVAMEEYIALLSKLVPGWSQGIHSFDKH